MMCAPDLFVTTNLPFLIITHHDMKGTCGGSHIPLPLLSSLELNTSESFNKIPPGTINFTFVFLLRQDLIIDSHVQSQTSQPPLKQMCLADFAASLEFCWAQHLVELSAPQLDIDTSSQPESKFCSDLFVVCDETESSATAVAPMNKLNSHCCHRSCDDNQCPRIHGSHSRNQHYLRS